MEVGRELEVGSMEEVEKKRGGAHDEAGRDYRAVAREGGETTWSKVSYFCEDSSIDPASSSSQGPKPAPDLAAPNPVSTLSSSV